MCSIIVTNKILEGGVDDRNHGIAAFGSVCRHLRWVRLRKLGSYAITKLRVFVTADTARIGRRFASSNDK